MWWTLVKQCWREWRCTHQWSPWIPYADDANVFPEIDANISVCSRCTKQRARIRSKWPRDRQGTILLIKGERVVKKVGPITLYQGYDHETYYLLAHCPPDMWLYQLKDESERDAHHTH